MKKLMTIVCALFLMVSATVTVFAQQSVVVTGVVQRASKAVDANGKSVEIVVDELEKKLEKSVVEKIIEEIKKLDLVRKVLEKDYVEGMKVIDVKEVYIKGDGKVTFPVDITFDVPGVTEKSKVGLMHYKDNEWEKIKAVPGKGTITGTFHSLSPVAFVVDAETAAAGEGATSPKTGESNVANYAIAVAILALGGMAVTLKGRKKA